MSDIRADPGARERITDEAPVTILEKPAGGTVEGLPGLKPQRSEPTTPVFGQARRRTQDILDAG